MRATHLVRENGAAHEKFPASHGRHAEGDVGAGNDAGVRPHVRLGDLHQVRAEEAVRVGGERQLVRRIAGHPARVRRTSRPIS